MEDLSPIAQPLAQKKMLKKLHKTIKKGSRPRRYAAYSPLTSFPIASKQRQVKRGVKEVVKAIRKGEKGYVALSLRLCRVC